MITNNKKTAYIHYIVKKNEIVTIYSVFLLDSLSTTSNITLAEQKVSVTADTQNFFQKV
jgi:glycerol-3-phosphate responsive antiterminator